jgi:hypothetical protein
MSRRTRTRTCVLVLSVALLAAACSSDEDSRIQTTDAGATRDATASPSSSASAAGPQPTDEPSGSGVEAAGGEGQAYVQPGATSRKAGEGNGLSVVDVRTGTHDGYDRVVLELGGEGTVGWRVAYDAAPATQGEGAPVELVGDATLSVLLENVGYPFDTGVEEYGGDTQPAPDLPQIKELRLGGVFEGYYDAFVGVGEQAPFRVFRLTDPQRVVVDVQQP